MNIVSLDADSLGDDVDFASVESAGRLIRYPNTAQDERIARVQEADVIITNKVSIDRELLDQAPRLKLVCVSATGVNNIDLEAARQQGIAVCNVAGYSTESVVQHTFALLFYLYSHLPYYDDYVKSGRYESSSLFTHFAATVHELAGKTWGIIGMGSIGRRVAEVARSFSLDVIYYSTSGKNNDTGFTQVDLPTLLERSDVLSIHAPLNEHTQNLITEKELSQMKSSSILINVGRGGIVNEADLARALDRGAIDAAGIDVLVNEPIEQENPLLQLKHPERIIVTPHMAWATREARQRVVEETSKNIQAFMEGQTRNRVV